MNDRQILVVDDEEQIRLMLKEAFAIHNYEVVTAESAEEALAIMRQQPCWVLFLDLNLPGMNGIDLCREIRRQWPMAVPFAVTGYVSLFELTECRDAGFEDYFTKPVSIVQLLAAADSAFAKLDRWKYR